MRRSCRAPPRCSAQRHFGRRRPRLAQMLRPEFQMDFSSQIDGQVRAHLRAWLEKHPSVTPQHGTRKRTSPFSDAIGAARMTFWDQGIYRQYPPDPDIPKSQSSRVKRMTQALCLPHNLQSRAKSYSVNNPRVSVETIAAALAARFNAQSLKVMHAMTRCHSR